MLLNSALTIAATFSHIQQGFALTILKLELINFTIKIVHVSEQKKSIVPYRVTLDLFPPFRTQTQTHTL